MAAGAIAYLDELDRVRAAPCPLRRELLHRLRSSSSATRLTATLELPRQRINYHLRALEAAGLVELVEERPRRGGVERIVRARAEAVVVDPGVISGDRGDPVNRIQDQYAAEHLVAVAADTVRRDRLVPGVSGRWRATGRFCRTSWSQCGRRGGY